MGAESFVIYYGLKFPVAEEDVKELMKAKHSYQVTAQHLGLDCYWGDFSPFEYEYGVFLGKEIGVLGAEHEWNQEVSEAELNRIIDTTKAILKKAGFKEEPKLLMHLQPDI